MTTMRMPLLPAYDRRPGIGPTLVFLHYWGGSARTWSFVVDSLADRDVLTLDFRGWSRSIRLPGPYTLDQLAIDTLAVLAAAGITDFVLVGHSMGGKVAQLISATQPYGLRGLVLIAPAPSKPPPHVTADYREGLSHAYDTIESVAAALDDTLTSRQLPVGIKSQIAIDSRSATDTARVEWPLEGIARDITEQTRSIRVPTLVVAGANDRVEPIHVLRDNLMPYLAHASLLNLPATGHLIPLESPVSLAEAIADFVPVT